MNPGQARRPDGPGVAITITAVNFLMNIMSPAGPRGRLSVLIFHRVLPVPDPLLGGVPDAARFDAICRWMREWFKVLPLNEAVPMLREGRLPASAAAITFDDGYADNHSVAVPILLHNRLAATFFVSPGYLDGGWMFNDSVVEFVRRAPGLELDLTQTVLGDLGVRSVASLDARRRLVTALLPPLKTATRAVRDEFCAQLQNAAKVCNRPGSLMMTSDQVAAIHREGMEVGAHTMGHPILAELDLASARREIVESRRVLQGITGGPIDLFAYPNGRPDADYLKSTVGLVKEAGFDAAFSTAWGAATQHSDPFQLPRFTPWDRTRLRFGVRMLGNLRIRHETTASRD